MGFTELRNFIEEKNAQLAISGRFLCANISNAYDFMVVMVKHSLSLNKDIWTATASFRVASSIEDCEFPVTNVGIDYVYMGPIIGIGIFSVLTAICICCCNGQACIHIGDYINIL